MKFVFSILLMTVLILSESVSLSVLLSDEHMEMTEQSKEDTKEKEAKEKRLDQCEKFSNRTNHFALLLLSSELFKKMVYGPLLQSSQCYIEINLPPPEGSC